MSGEGARNQVHREAQRVIDRRIRRAPCIVDSYNPQIHAVKVKLQPSGLVTGWMQVETAQIGLMIAPSVNDPGWVEFHEDDRRAGVFVGSTFNDNFPLPKQIAAGECYYQNNSGASIYFKADGSITLTDKGGATAVFDGSGNVAVTATSIKLGSSGGTLKKLVTDAFQLLFNQHTHPGNGQPPTQQMGSSHLTSAVSAD